MFFSFLLNLILVSLGTNFPVANGLEMLNQQTVSEVRVLPEIPDKPKIPEKTEESLGLEISAKSAIVIDEDSGAILFEKNSQEILPIASLTKLVTIDTVLEEGVDLYQEFNLIPSDFVEDPGLKLSFQDRVVVRDLLYASLVSSANNAAEAVSRTTGLSRGEFIERMNEKVKMMGLENTHFEDVTGLSAKNVSTAREFIKLAQEAFNNPEIQRATLIKKHIFKIVNSDREYAVNNTNKLLGSYLNIEAGKTGFTQEAGNCLALKVRNDNGKSILILVLGATTSENRFQEAKGLATWTFENYKW